MTLSRVKCLVSMTTPRDPRLHGVAIMPAFVEFDMSAEGFGALFLPSITPQVRPASIVVFVGVFFVVVFLATKTAVYATLVGRIKLIDSRLEHIWNGVV